MRRVFLLLLVLLLIACSPGTSKDSLEKEGKPNPVNTVPSSGEYIIAGRRGNEQGVYAIDISTGQIHKEIYSGEYIVLSALKDKVLIYRNKSSKVGEFLLKNLSGDTITSIDTNWLLSDSSKPVLRPDGKGVVYVGEDKGLYYADFEREKVEKINVQGDIKYLHFIDDDAVIYSKIDKGKYQTYKFDLKGYSEEKLVDSNYNDLSPVMSGNKTKLAFLRYDNGKYIPYVKNMSSSEDKCIFRDEGVLGGSLKWSKSQNYLMFSVEKSGVERVKLHKFETSFTTELSRAYSAIFSPDGESVAYVEYTEDSSGDKPEMVQRVYTKYLKDAEPEKVFETREGAVYSKSFEILLWYNGEIP